MSSSNSFVNSKNDDPHTPNALGDSIYENRDPTPPNESDRTPLNSDPELPKVWGIHDPFQFAPPKPDGDPWLLLLEPLLAEDKTRCDSWRDEVQNLLIFAGLFSAVVTAFIVESYKNLQPDPDQTAVLLLAHIAMRLDTPSNSSLPLLLPPFSPSTSSTRVNVFWFVSLVLSLMTVLVGIISLQWLREHQTYSDLSPRATYAVYHMQHQALSQWHVPKIFTALPLLLQSALVLFLLGIVDFLRTFSDSWAVTAPVAALIGLMLVFLIATAVLPTLHTLSLYFNFTHEYNLPGDQKRGKKENMYINAPCPCPYKSPQSHAIRTLLIPAFHLCDYLHPRLRRAHHRMRVLVQHTKHLFTLTFTSNVDGSTDSDPPIPALPIETFTRYLRYTLWASRWVEFDVCWLAIRDGYMRRAYGRSAYFEKIGARPDNVPPLLDVVSLLSLQSYQKATASAAYHCFSEVSEEALRPLTSEDFVYRSIGRGTTKIDSLSQQADKPNDRFLQSSYLHDVLEWTCAVTEVFRMEVLLRPDKAKTLHAMLHQQNLHAFTITHFFSDSSLLSNHRKELTLRLSTYFYANASKDTLTLRSQWNTGNVGNDRNDLAFQSLESRNKLSTKKIRFPKCLLFSPFEALLEPDMERGAFDAIAWQAAHTMHSILQQIDALPTTTTTISPLLFTSLILKAGIPAFIRGAAYFSSNSIQHTYHSSITSTSTDTHSLIDPHLRIQRRLQQALIAKHKATFDFIAHRLSCEMDSWTSARAGSGPSLLFYVAALYASANWVLSRIKLAPDVDDGQASRAGERDRGMTGNLNTNFNAESDSTTKSTTPSEAISSFISMQAVILKYKRRTIEMGLVDSFVETCLAEDESFWRKWSKRPFSDVWWAWFEDGGCLPGGRGGVSGSEEPDEVGSVHSAIGPGRGEDDIIVFYPFSSS